LSLIDQKLAKHTRRKSHSPNHNKQESHTIHRRGIPIPKKGPESPENYRENNSDEEHVTSDNENLGHPVVCSDSGSNENSPRSGDISLGRSAPKILHHLRHRRKKDHKTPPELDHDPSTMNPCPILEPEMIISDEEIKLNNSGNLDRTKAIHHKKSKTRKNRTQLNEDSRGDESEEGSPPEHEPSDAKSELSDSHPKKHHFHFPIFHLWNHKRSVSHKKERDGEHSSEHENDIERMNSHGTTRRTRDSESQPHRRHTLSPRFVTSHFFDDTHLEEHNEIPKN